MKIPLLSSYQFLSSISEASAPANSSFQALPNEVIQNIFHFLPKSDLLQTRLLSQALKANGEAVLARQLIIPLKETTPLSILEAGICRHLKISAPLTLEQENAIDWQEVESLDLMAFPNQASLAAIIQKCPNLQKLTVNITQIQYLKNLECFKENRPFQLQCLRGCGFHLKYLDSLQDDPYAILIAIKDYPSAFQYVSENLKKERSFILKAAAINGIIVNQVRGQFGDDPEIALTALKSQHYRAYSPILGADLASNREFMLKAIAICKDIFIEANEALKDDFELALAAIPEKNSCSLKLNSISYTPRISLNLLAIGHELLANKAFIIAALAKNEDILSLVDGQWLSDPEVLLAKKAKKEADIQKSIEKTFNFSVDHVKIEKVAADFLIQNDSKISNDSSIWSRLKNALKFNYRFS